MKKALSLILALALCLSLCACGSNNSEDLKNTLCTGVWVSTDNINNKLGAGYSQAYPTIRFFEDGTCETVFESYKDGALVGSDTSKKNWKIEDGKVAVYPDIVDSDKDTIYYEYSDGKLLGSAWYCDRFTYTQDTSADSSGGETTETTLQLLCYTGTQFPTIEAVIPSMYCEPTVTEDEFCVRYRYTDKNVQTNEYFNMNGEFQIFSKTYKADVLSGFEKVEYVHKISDTRSYTYSAWLDGAGNALMIEATLSGTTYNLDICIFKAENVQAYVDTLDQ